MASLADNNGNVWLFYLQRLKSRDEGGGPGGPEGGLGHSVTSRPTPASPAPALACRWGSDVV